MTSLEYISLMKKALGLARKAEGEVHHYPMVGAVVVKNGRIVGQGYFHAPGEPHAEVLALRQAGKLAQGATLVLNLEPCSHFGRTPPCADFVIASGVRRVVAGMTDPNPKVSGRGFAKIRAAGIEVIEGVLEEECRRINEVFVKFITTGRPFVTLKAAITLDGAVATRSGDSKWITGEPARKMVHRMRDVTDAVMVGAGTVMADDPELTVRLAGKGRHPRPVVVDSRLRIPLTARIMHTPAASGPIIACTAKAPKKQVEAFRKAGAEVFVLPEDREGRVDLTRLMARLGEIKIASVLLEGGAELFGSALRSGVVDKVVVFISPRILPGDAKRFLAGPAPEKIQDALRLKDVSIKKIGSDICLTGYINQPR